MEEKIRKPILIVITVIAVVIIIIFLKSSITKFFNLDYFEYTIRKYPFGLDDTTSFYGAIIISSIELFGALSFFLFSLRKSFLLSFSLYVIFIGSLTSLIVKNNFFDCGCGLFYKTMNPVFMLGFDIIVAAIVLSAFIHLSKKSYDKKLYTAIKRVFAEEK